MEISVITLPRVCSTQPCRHPSTWCNSPFTPILKGAAEEVEVAAEVAAVEATRPTLSSSNLLNDTQTNVLASSHPGQKGIIVSETLLGYFHPHTLPEGEKTLSVQSLQERAKTPCVQSLQERQRLLVYSPFRRGKRLLVQNQTYQWEADSGVFLPSGNIKGPTGLYSVYSGTVTNCLSEIAQTCPGCPASPAVTQAPTDKVPY